MNNVHVHDEWSLSHQAVRAAPKSYSAGFGRFTCIDWFADEDWVRNEHWFTHFHKRERHTNAVAGQAWLSLVRHTARSHGKAEKTSEYGMLQILCWHGRGQGTLVGIVPLLR